MSQVSFANAVIDHLRVYGIRMRRDEWAAVRVWLEKSAEELETWARDQERETCAEEVRSVDPTNGAIRVIAARMLRHRA